MSSEGVTLLHMDVCRKRTEAVASRELIDVAIVIKIYTEQELSEVADGGVVDTRLLQQAATEDNAIPKQGCTMSISTTDDDLSAWFDNIF
jgi:hypothetical protein